LKSGGARGDTVHEGNMSLSENLSSEALFVYRQSCDCGWAHKNPAACDEQDDGVCFKACCDATARKVCNATDRGDCSCDCRWADHNACKYDDAGCCWDCCCRDLQDVFRTRGEVPRQCFRSAAAENSTEYAKEPLPSLFCFAVMVPQTYEGDLLRMQYERGASLFACDGSKVYSSEVLSIGPGMETALVNSTLKCKYGGKYNTALNTPIFMSVWEQVGLDEDYRRFDWTVKVDPDAVFFAWRLRALLQNHKESRYGVYLNNCRFGLHGPIEVFSRNAIAVWSKGRTLCIEYFENECDGECPWGEDMFVDQCLERVLKVDRVNTSFLLLEDHCDPPHGWQECDDPLHVSFHPFKNVSDYRRCMDTAVGVCPPPATTSTASPRPAVVSTSTASARLRRFQCDEERIRDWPATERMFCCQSYRLGCTGSDDADDDLESAGTCNMACPDIGNPAATCGSHLRTLAQRKSATSSRPCEDSYALLVQLCPACRGCTAEASACAGALAPTPGTPTTAVAAPTVKDCDEGWPNWEWEWSPEKMDWCCTHTGRGCRRHVAQDLFDCDVDFDNWEESWSSHKKSWCCDQHGRGCQVFNCNEDWNDWARGWSLDKRMWCCRHQSRGCLVD